MNAWYKLYILLKYWIVAMLTMVMTVGAHASDLPTLLHQAREMRDSGKSFAQQEQALNALLIESRLRLDVDMEAEALLMRLNLYFNNQDKDKYFALADSIENLPIIIENKRNHVNFLCTDIFALHDSNQTAKAINLNKELYDLSKQTNDTYGMALSLCYMGNFYIAAGRIDDAEQSLFDSWAMVEQIEDPLMRIKMMYLCSSRLIDMLNNKGDYTQSIEILNKWHDTNTTYRNQEIELTGSSYYCDISEAYSCVFSAETYTLVHDFDTADKYLSKLEKVNQNYPVLMHIDYLEAKHLLLMEVGNYAEAYAVGRQLQQYYKSTNSIIQYLQIINANRKALRHLGRLEEALDQCDELVALQDSVTATRHFAQLNEMRTIYDVDRLEEQARQQKMIIIFVSVICLLLILLMVVAAIYSRRLAHKNQRLYTQINELMRTDQETERTLQLVPEADLSKEMKLFRELSQLMNSEKLFLENPITRASVAARLGTNEKYLANAIKDGADTTFTNYICGLRLAHSIELLTNSTELTLDAVAQESGFGSYSPFFKAFVNRYGMSPSEFRKMATKGYKTIQFDESD